MDVNNLSLFLELASDIMPVSLEQWRASVGLNNAARSRVLNKLGGKRPPKDLLSQFGLFLLRLVAGVFGFPAGEGECCTILVSPSNLQ